MVRIDGRLARSERTSAHSRCRHTIVTDLLGPQLAERLEIEREVDFSFGWEWQARFRGNAFHQRGSSARAAVIPREIPTFEQMACRRPSARSQTSHRAWCS